MAAYSSVGRPAASAAASERRLAVRRFERRVRLADGLTTTVHLAAYARAFVRVRVGVLERPQPLARWCREQGFTDALVGGFFTRPQGLPLGEVRVAGEAAEYEPFLAPWGSLRAAVHCDNEIVIARRDALPAVVGGDLLQAGPLLVRDGLNVVDGDAEGFSSGAAQFDSDITDGRYPRAALAVTARQVLAVACDGRSEGDAGMTLGELAEFLIRRGAREALNLDGGGSASLVSGGRLLNRPREAHGIDLLEGRAISTALVFTAAGG